MIEQQMLEFKIGLCGLNQEKKYNKQCLSKIVKTLTAMGNTEFGKKGYILLGIADKQEDSNLHRKIYDAEPRKFNTYYIVGVKDEADSSMGSLDNYFGKIRQEVEKEPIDEDVKSYILRHMKQITYYDKALILFEICAEDKPLVYDGKYYERNANSVIELEAGTEQFNNLMRRAYTRN